MRSAQSLVNQPAPSIRLQDQDGREHTLEQYRGQYVLLYFYPKDMTPGCTIEALGFRDVLPQLTNEHVVVKHYDTVDPQKTPATGAR